MPRSACACLQPVQVTAIEIRYVLKGYLFTINSRCSHIYMCDWECSACVNCRTVLGREPHYFMAVSLILIVCERLRYSFVIVEHSIRSIYGCIWCWAQSEIAWCMQSKDRPSLFTVDGDDEHADRFADATRDPCLLVNHAYYCLWYRVIVTLFWW